MNCNSFTYSYSWPLLLATNNKLSVGPVFCARVSVMDMWISVAVLPRQEEEEEDDEAEEENGADEDDDLSAFKKKVRNAATCAVLVADFTDLVVPV